MKISVIAIVAVAFILGCSQRDPFDHLMTRVEHEDVESYMFLPIRLPAAASADECIAVLTNRGELRVEKTLATRLAHTSHESFTAVLLESDAGQKIVLMHPLPKRTNEWYYRIYDVK